MRRNRGVIALPFAVMLAAVLAAIAATIVSSAGVEATVTQRRRATVRGLAAVDGCLSQVVAARAAGWDFAADLVGPDGVAGTGDDGTIAAPSGCSVQATAAPAGMLLTVTAQLPDGARAVDAVLTRSLSPGVSTPLWATGLPALTGVDGPSTLDAPATPAVPIVAAPVLPTALDAWLAAHPNVLHGATAPPRYAPAPPLDALAARAQLIGVPAASALTTSAPPTTVAYVSGDLTVSGPLQGVGVLVISGRLSLTAPLDYRGVVVALQGVQSDPTAALHIQGALWLGTGPTPPDIRGPLTVIYDSAVLAIADALLPLPRGAQVLSLRDREL